MLFVCPTTPPSSPSEAEAALWASRKVGSPDASGRVEQLSELPSASETTLVLPALALSWHRVTLPRIQPARLKLALSGLLEDRLLADTQNLHLVAAPGAQAGQPSWVAVCDAAWLQSWLDRLEQAGHPVRRVVPECVPQDTPSLGLWRQFGRPHLLAAGPQGVRLHPLPQRDSDRQDTSGLGDFFQWLGSASSDTPPSPALVATTEPDLLTKAVEVCARPFSAETLAQRWDRSASQGWNLIPSDRESRGHAVPTTAAHLRGWRLARWGLVATGLALVGGLNAAAWQAQAQQRELQQQTKLAVQSAFPQIDLVLNAPVQMRREMERLQASGQGGHSLEHLLQTLAPAIQTPTQLTALDFDTQGARLTFDPQSEPDLSTLQAPLASALWAAPERHPDGWRLRPLPVSNAAPPSP